MSLGIEPTAGDLVELATKYRMLGEMRRRELAGFAPREDAHYREIARRFPGALKELDQLELEEIDRRHAALVEGARTGEIALWMRLVHGYHSFLRAALRVRLALRSRRKRGDESEASTSELAEIASHEAGFAIAVSEIEELLAPGQCRLVPAAVLFVASRTGAPISEVRVALAIRAPRS